MTITAGIDIGALYGRAINMVSRAISTPNILKGIDLSMAGRLVKLLKMAEGTVLTTGGLALDSGLVAAMRELMAEQKFELTVVSHPDSIHAGAIGAATWGAYRYQWLAELGQLAQASRPGPAPAHAHGEIPWPCCSPTNAWAPTTSPSTQGSRLDPYVERSALFSAPLARPSGNRQWRGQ